MADFKIDDKMEEIMVSEMEAGMVEECKEIAESVIPTIKIGKRTSNVDIERLKNEGYNQEQLQVICSDFPILNIAGPGSGKTKTLIAKTTEQLVKNVDDLKHSLILTFTNSASNEILERLGTKLNQELDRKDFYAGTFHGMFYKLLRENNEVLIEKYGFTKSPKILDSNEDDHLYKKVFESVFMKGVASLKRIVAEGEKEEILTKKEVNKQFSSVHGMLPMDVYYTMINATNGVPKELDSIIQAVVKRSMAENQDDINQLTDMVRVYMQSKREDNALSFNDILLYTYLSLKENPEMLTKVQNQFDYILVDEYQDTNPIQAKIIEMIDRNNTCIIGDPYQSIYKFLGASVKSIMKKADAKDMNLIQLTKNYRSSPNIVNLTNDLTSLFIERVDGHQPCSSEAVGVKNLPVQFKEGVNVEYNILNGIKYRKKMGIDYKDMAIIFRTGLQEMTTMEKTLLREKIPFIKRGGKGFYSEKEIKFMVDIAKIVSGEYSLKNLSNLCNVFDGLGPKMFDKVQKSYIERENRRDTLQDVILKEYGGKKALVEFSNLIFGEAVDNSTPNLFAEPTEEVKRDFKRFMEIMSYPKINLVEKQMSLADTISKKKKIESNIEYFKEELYEIFKMNDNEYLVDFLNDISLDQNFGIEDGETPDRVVLTTAHSSKGLEWNTVFIGNAEDGMFPSGKALDADIKEGAMNPQLEEEKRLFYVAVSRSKESLTILSNGQLNSFVQPFLENRYADVYSKLKK